ncbi:hypothetical protein DV736_g2373, partial [Chaetothyriales sp. CBS 134916]
MSNHTIPHTPDQAQVSPGRGSVVAPLPRRSTLPRRIGPWPIKRVRSEGDRANEPRGIPFDGLVDETKDKTTFGAALKKIDAECAKIEKILALSSTELSASAGSDPSEQNTATNRALEQPQTQFALIMATTYVFTSQQGARMMLMGRTQQAQLRNLQVLMTLNLSTDRLTAMSALALLEKTINVRDRSIESVLDKAVCQLVSISICAAVVDLSTVIGLLPLCGHGQEDEEHLLHDASFSPGSARSRQPGSDDGRPSLESITSASTTSLVLEHLNNMPTRGWTEKAGGYRDDDSDPELPRDQNLNGGSDTAALSLKRAIWIVSAVALVGWILALGLFLATGRPRLSSSYNYDHENPKQGPGKPVTFDQIMTGQWAARSASVAWIAGPNGEDGLLLEAGNLAKDYLVVEDIRSRDNGLASAWKTKTLLKSSYFVYRGSRFEVAGYWVSSDMSKVLVITNKEKLWRHSYTGVYYIVDVATQEAEPLLPYEPDAIVQLATWSPDGKHIVFTKDNNLFLRMLESNAVRQITDDGGPNYFYGIPDWVYEEEVFSNNIAMWWSRDSQYVAFLRTNETLVPEYPVQYFIKRPEGQTAGAGLEAYPNVRKIKYPKAGAPNPVVDMLFYDIARNEKFPVDVSGGFPDDDRLIVNCLWADDGKVLVQEANRESDRFRYILVDVVERTGKTVRSVDLKALDGGWVEPAQRATYVPADPANGRPMDGYIDTTVYENNDHLAYFTPLDNPLPIMLTKGNWEVVRGPTAVDLQHNLVYFISTAASPIQRHLFSVKLDGSELTAITPTTEIAVYDAEFSSASGFLTLGYGGPQIPWQRVVSSPTSGTSFNLTLEDNKDLAKKAKEHELPHQAFSNITINGTTLQVVERRPPHFDSSRKYPVLFFLYGGPGSQTVSRRFHVDFQSYVASSLGYIAVTVDNRGTGFIGRKARTIIREHFGYYEAHDQIATAKEWAQKPYVDADRIAIWGWSYGGFMTLKVLETDAGQTFKYGMSVAPVTDWRFYDSIYTERYMRTPQNNPDGYDSSAISNATALGQNVRFLVIHGTGDDNVHYQNTLTLLDKLDLAGVDNYDVHFFPDSDHSIYFHNANYMVYQKLSKWLTNAFNGVWEKLEDPRPD